MIEIRYDMWYSDIYNFYGVKKNFKIKKLIYPNLAGGAFFLFVSNISNYYVVY